MTGNDQNSGPSKKKKKRKKTRVANESSHHICNIDIGLFCSVHIMGTASNGNELRLGHKHLTFSQLHITYYITLHCTHIERCTFGRSISVRSNSATLWLTDDNSPYRRNISNAAGKRVCVAQMNMLLTQGNASIHSTLLSSSSSSSPP